MADTFSGNIEQFASGAIRDSRNGKGRFDLLPPRAMLRLARHFELGAKKYGDRNWERGMPISRFLDSALRHVFAYLAGQNDEDHLIAAAWNILAAAEIESRVELDLLPQDLCDVGPHKSK